MSVGVDFNLDPTVGDVEWNEKDQVYDVKRASWRETSSTPMPAFDDARVTKVAASRTPKEPGMPEQNEPNEAQTTPPAAGGVQLNQDQLTMLLSRPGAIQALVAAQQPQTQAGEQVMPTGALTLSAEQVDGLIRAGQLGALLGVPHLGPAAPSTQEQRASVDPTRRTIAASQVREAIPYRFDRKGNLTAGPQYDFSSDLWRAQRGDGESYERALTFARGQIGGFVASSATAAEFETDMADVAALNPSRQRPDLWVDQLDYATPLWDFVNRGPIADASPFIVPKFSSSSGLVGDHTQNQEPTAGTYVTTTQTITPSPLSGKAEITREAWDQG
ncbi:hypothetical protein ACIBF5_32730, partial [Micromonospora sp. NPDC050417]|uniref:hypothetical protein n=1 Tax=Micromonospora sp. NPDC050417 TaxID=3364280 RepID=UPI0037A501DD